MLRIWGVKAFLDGSLGSRTAEMLDGSGTARLTQAELEDMVVRCARAELNVCLHAIGDGAVRRALDALAPRHGAWRGWRPRIEHAQCVNPKDMPRFARYGVIASMQPIHAVADRELADATWPGVTRYAYAWGALARDGARLAFGSDAPVETADPLAGIDAATSWRKRASWHPELALTRASALRAYTSSAAYAVGMEKDLGSLRVGKQCDMTVVDGEGVVATVVGARVKWLQQVFVDNLDVADHRHEVGVPVPAWDDVKMHVIGDAGSRHAAYVRAQIEAFGLQVLLEDTDRPLHRPHQVSGLHIVEILELGLMHEGRHHGVAGVIRKLVQHHDRAFRAPDDELGIAVVGMLDDSTEEAAGTRLLGDVLRAPRRPQSLH
jgi:hypothetical protein